METGNRECERKKTKTKGRMKRPTLVLLATRSKKQWRFPGLNRGPYARWLAWQLQAYATPNWAKTPVIDGLENCESIPYATNLVKPRICSVHLPDIRLSEGTRKSLCRRVCAAKDDLFSTVVSIEAGTTTLARRVLDISLYARETGMTRGNKAIFQRRKESRIERKRTD